jgi:TPR repeat protein
MRSIFTCLLMCLFLLAGQAFPCLAAQGQAQSATPAPQPAPTQSAPAQQRIQPEAAFALMAAEAEKGSGSAMLALGRFYEQGVGVARNYTKAMQWYEKAAKAGQPEGWYNLGVCFEIGMGAAADAAKAVQHYQKAADMGLALAMYKLSSIYISGTGVSKDPAKGIGWLEKAANAGMAAAANDLGAIWLSGLLGQKKDEKKALSMFMKAADLGNLEAIKNIAVMHKDGIGTKADPAAAYTWYLIARRGGYAGEDIARMLGLLEGSLTPAQTQKAQKDADIWLESYLKRQSGGQ